MEKLCRLLGPTDGQNGKTIIDTLLDYFPQNLPNYIDVSLNSKRLSEPGSEQAHECSSQTDTSLMTCVTQSLTPEASITSDPAASGLEVNLTPTQPVEVPETQKEESAIVGINPLGARSTMIVSGDMSASGVEETIKERSALKSSKTEMLKGNIPKYLRYNYYDPSIILPKTLVQWSCFAKPLPTPSSDD
ncbi:hypothetical protein C0992_005321 [Termitomyces sp. T32_za158]|nr:hypothetical protein C0992_005321 [Termitomyces sp. T32_za158]